MSCQIELTSDGKSSMFVLTKTDKEGFHHTLFLSKHELIAVFAAIRVQLTSKDA